MKEHIGKEVTTSRFKGQRITIAQTGSFTLPAATGCAGRLLESSGHHRGRVNCARIRVCVCVRRYDQGLQTL